ncbi:MAG: hypothetical protein IKK57_00995 [Clostridia bacterium]|nr:hypothetical protein [Clostridia bacterium]
MSDFTMKLKDILTDGLRAVSKAAGNVAGATRYKLDELDRVSRRREAIGELGEKVYEMFQAGVEMPEDALPLLNELAALEEGLQTMRAEHAEQKAANKQKKQEDAAARKEQRAAEKAARAAAKQAADTALADAQADMEAAEAFIPVEEAADVQEAAPVLEVAGVQDAEEAKEKREDDMMLM